MELDHQTAVRRAYVRSKAKSLGFDPDELDFEDGERNPTYSPSGFKKTPEITALIRLLEHRGKEEQATTKKTKKGVAS